MIISDLSYLEPISECIDVLGGAAAGVSATGLALGRNSTYTKASGYTTANPLSGGGSLALGIASVIGVASDPKNATVKTSVSGAAQGDIAIVVPVNVNVNAGSLAIGVGVVTAIGFDFP